MKVLSASEVRADLAPVLVTCLDTHYTVVTHRWLTREFLPFWAQWLFSLGSQYVLNKWDCDKFARAFQSQMHIACFQAHAAHSGAIGFIATNDKGGHALNILKTDRGWYEVEPQNSRVTPLRKERKEIRYAIF